MQCTLYTAQCTLHKDIQYNYVQLHCNSKMQCRILLIRRYQITADLYLIIGQHCYDIVYNGKTTWGVEMEVSWWGESGSRWGLWGVPHGTYSRSYISGCSEQLYYEMAYKVVCGIMGLTGVYDVWQMGVVCENISRHLVQQLNSTLYETSQ